MISTAGVIIVKEGKVLMVRHGISADHPTGLYGFPAGRIQEGESKRGAAARELKEETGLIVQEEDLVEFPGGYIQDEIERKGEGKTLMDLQMFWARDFSGELQSREEKDEAFPEWVEIERLSELRLLPNVEKILRAALDSEKKGDFSRELKGKLK
jgi:8-oxo-dGTP pyrophosphatase MutT (NUDIX family)